MAGQLILGGAGKVGRRVAELLRAAGDTPRIAGRGGPVRFDWAARETWAPALAGVEGVFVVGPGSSTDYSPLIGELMTAAHGAGVERAVLLSARAVEFQPDGVVARAERVLADGPVAWTILRPAWFAQNFTEGFFAPRRDTVTAPVGDGREPFVDVADIAEVAAIALASDRLAGETISLSGPSALTFAEAVAVLSEHAGRPLSFVASDPSAYARSLREDGLAARYVDWRMAMLDGIRGGQDAYISDGVERVLGRRATSFTEFAARDGHLIAA